MMKVNDTDKSTWQTVRFGDVVREVRETEPDPLAKGITRYVGLADLDPDSLQLKRWSEIADGETTFTRLFRQGQILFGRRRAYQRKAAVAPFDGICSGDIIVMEAKRGKLLPELLPFLIHTDGFFDYAIQTSAGSLSPRTKWTHLAKYEFALPPLDEQRRMAEVLWASEEAKREYHNALNVLEKTKLIVLRYMFGEQSKIRLATIGEITKWQTGSTPSKHNKQYWEAGNILWVTPKDAKAIFIDETEDKITDLAIFETNLKLHPANSITLVWRSGILQHTLPVIKVGFPFTTNQDMKVLKINGSSVNPEYIRQFLLTFESELLQKCVKRGTTVESIDTDMFLNYPIPCPSKELQDEAIKIALQFDKSIENLKTTIQKQMDMQKKLIHVIEGGNVQ